MVISSTHSNTVKLVHKLAKPANIDGKTNQIQQQYVFKITAWT